MKYFEDTAIGERLELGAHQFRADDIKAVARRFDPQRFHLDEGEAERSHFGGLCASGWHTGFVWMRMFVEYRNALTKKMRARGEPVAKLGPSPGFQALKWPRPVYAGDTISFAMEVVEKRESKSRPDWGIVQFLVTGTNQRGEPVFTFSSINFVERRAGRSA